MVAIFFFFFKFFFQNSRQLIYRVILVSDVEFSDWSLICSMQWSSQVTFSFFNKYFLKVVLQAFQLFYGIGCVYYNYLVFPFKIILLAYTKKKNNSIYILLNKKHKYFLKTPMVIKSTRWIFLYFIYNCYSLFSIFFLFVIFFFAIHIGYFADFW